MSELTPEQASTRADLRCTLFDDIAAAAGPEIVAGFEVLLIWAATEGES